MFFTEIELPGRVVLLDSFNTTNQGVLIVGEEVDPFFGKSSGRGFSRMFIDVTEDRPTSEAIFDSVFFYLDVVSVNGENLDQPKEISIHKLTQPLLDTVYYNFDELPFENVPFSQAEITFDDIRDTTVKMPVNEEFGLELFEKIVRGREFSDLFSFRNYFPGIAVTAREGDNTTVGVNLGFLTNLSFYYHLVGDTIPSIYEINTASSRSFNGVKSDRSGSTTATVEDLGKDYDVGPLVGLKANLGMTIKLDTSPFDPFLDTLDGVTFNQVNFEIGKIEAQSETQNPISSMVVYFTDDSNGILTRSDGRPLTLQTDGQPQIELDADGNEQPAVNAPAILSFNENTDTYVTQISTYMGALYRNEITRRDWLLYGNSPQTSGDDFKRSFREFLVNQENIKVKVIYSKIR